MDRGPIRTPRSPAGGGMINSRPDTPPPPYRPPEEEPKVVEPKSEPKPEPKVEKPEPAQQSIKEELQKVQHASPRHFVTDKVEKPKRRLKLPLIVAGIIVVIILAIVGFVLIRGAGSSTVGIDTSKYQAVFFTNGQVYFGKLKIVNRDFLQLSDIFYLQTQSSTSDTSSTLQKTSSDSSDVQLIKLGSEIHGPEDQMTISRTQVLFYENLKTNGKVAQSITQYKADHK